MPCRVLLVAADVSDGRCRRDRRGVASFESAKLSSAARVGWIVNESPAFIAPETVMFSPFIVPLVAGRDRSVERRPPVAVGQRVLRCRRRKACSRRSVGCVRIGERRRRASRCRCCARSRRSSGCRPRTARRRALPFRSMPSAFCCVHLRGEARRDRAELRLRRVERLAAEIEQAADRAARRAPNLSM